MRFFLGRACRASTFVRRERSVLASSFSPNLCHPDHILPLHKATQPLSTRLRLPRRAAAALPLAYYHTRSGSRPRLDPALSFLPFRFSLFALLSAVSVVVPSKPHTAQNTTQNKNTAKVCSNYHRLDLVTNPQS